ncbi:MAG: molybdate ABC transporter substrate-binding protein [Acidimicrobiia bacterium]|nr:molybdate ABC transporter substrate-binding protein [Acidimicrobiia bacterium]
MSEAVEALGEAYEPLKVELSVAGSQVLVAQVREGAPLDIIVTADSATAAALSGLGVVAGEAVAFARNRLAIAVPEGNPRGIRGLDDLAASELTLVLAAPAVPAGRYTAELLDAAGLTLSPSSLEPSVRAVLSKVQLGEADAGIVYRTDLNRPGVTGVEIPDAVNPIAEYFAAALTSASDPEEAASFVTFLGTPPAQQILAELGFSS